MPEAKSMPKRSLKFLLVFLLASVWVMLVQAQPGKADALQAKYRELQGRLANNPFGRPVWLDSKQGANEVEGIVYGVISHPYRNVKSALTQAENWCEILFLHLNVKYCSASQDEGGNMLTLYTGRKTYQELSSAYRIDYRFRLGPVTNDYMQVALKADAGPFGTSDYSIMLEAIPLGADRTFIHVRYSYDYGVMAKVAMQTYLNTLGSGKVGFTVEGEDADGNPVYVTGLRGATERNIMRYYLAIDTYLKSLRLPEEERSEARLREWFRATERYARQLHELSQRDYMTMKRKEYERMQFGQQNGIPKNGS